MSDLLQPVAAEAPARPDPKDGEPVRIDSAETDSVDTDSVETDSVDAACVADDTGEGETPPGEPAAEAADPKPAEEPSVQPSEVRSARPAPRDPDPPIFAEMFAAWNGPAASVIGRRLSRSEAATTVIAPLPRRHDPKRPRREPYVMLRTERGAPVLVVRGDFDAAGPDLAACLRRVLPSHPRHIVVDLSAVTSFTPAGSRALVRLGAAGRAKGADVLLRAPSRPVLDVLRSGPRMPRDGSADAEDEDAPARAAAPEVGESKAAESARRRHGR